MPKPVSEAVCLWVHVQCMACTARFPGTPDDARLWRRFHHGPFSVLALRVRDAAGEESQWQMVPPPDMIRMLP